MMQEFDPAQQRSEMRENVPEDLRDAYDRIIGAGMKFMFSDQTHGEMVKMLKGQGTLDDKLSAGVAYLMMNMVQQSNGTMPPELIIPAGIDLILQAAEFAEKTGMDQVTTEIIANAMHKYVLLVAKKAGVSEDQLMNGIDKLSQGAKNGPQ
jgi:hypothetical protein